MVLSHGHPPSLSSRSGRRSQQTLHANTNPTCPSPPSLQHDDRPFAFQTRRLLRRNAAFRGTKMSSPRADMKITRLSKGPEIPQSESPPPRNEENTSPQNRSANSIRGDHYTSRTLGVSTNSTRSPYSQQLSKIPIAEDNLELTLLEISPTANTPESSYHDASSTQQPLPHFHETNAEFDTMRLREISGNEGRSPHSLSSPLVMHVRGRKRRGLDPRKTSFRASEYIEHIESQLQQIKEAMYSPNTGRPLREKVKVLEAENKQLRETLSELEETFDERVNQALEHKAVVEVAMSKKIKALEDELASKENTISYLQNDRVESKSGGSNVEGLLLVIERQKAEKESLERASRVIEKRNEALTGLLAQSPTRIHQGFRMASPTLQDLTRTPRPKSMIIPKTSSSIHISPTRLPTGYLNSNTSLSLEKHTQCNAARRSPRKVSKSESLDSGIGDSCSTHSPARGGSRRSSIASHASASPSAWVLPLPASPFSEKVKARQNKNRRTRRFESGSTQLKPLLLPAMAAEGNTLHTFHTAAPHSSPTHRDFSEQSLDPTTSFLSQSFEMPIQLPAMPSKWVSAEALKALEDSAESHFESFEDIIARDAYELASLDPSADQNEIPDNMHDAYVRESHSPAFIHDTIIEQDITTLLNHPESRVPGAQIISSLNGKAWSGAEDQESTGSNEQDVTSSKWRSSSAAEPKLVQASDNGLNSRYRPHGQALADRSQVVVPRSPFLPSAPDRSINLSSLLTERASLILLSGSVDDSPVPRKRQRSSNPGSCSFVMPTLCINPAHGGTGHTESLSDTNLGPFTTSIDTGPTPRSNKRTSRPRSPLDMLDKRTSSPIPLASVTIRTIFGTLSRYTSYVREMRRDPATLARGVMANAWQYNWSRLGWLSWWVLGLFLGPGVRAEQLDHGNSTSGDWGQYEGEATAEEVCILEIRATEQKCNISCQQPTSGPSDPESVEFEGSDPRYRTAGTQTKPRPAIKNDDQNWQKRKPGWRKSLYLWGKFSIAIMLAVGGAVMNGPEEMLGDCTEHTPKEISPTMYERPICETPNRKLPEEQQSTPTSANDSSVSGMRQPANANKTPINVTDFQRPAEDVATHYPLYY